MGSLYLLPLFFFLRDVQTILFLLHFHMIFRISLSISLKKLAWILGRFAGICRLFSGKILIINIWIYEHGMFFCLIGSLISLNNVLNFVMCISCLFFLSVKFISMCFRIHLLLEHNQPKREIQNGQLLLLNSLRRQLISFPLSKVGRETVR